MEKREEKRNNLAIVAVVLLLLVMVCVIMLSRTYAKYTSKVSGEDTATIAKWAWEINDVGLESTTTTYTLNLFSTVNDTGNTAAETDVAESKMIAPGTEGKFEVKIENLSDVNAKYSVAFTETNPLDAKIVYSTDGTTYKEVSELNVTDKEIAKTNGSDTFTVYWKWVFDESESQDTADTNVGFSAAQASDRTVKVKADLTFVQVD